jgi:hypothetical protein
MKRKFVLVALALVMSTGIAKTSFAQVPTGTINMKSLKARTSFNDTIAASVVKTQYGDFGFAASKVSIQATIYKISGTVAGKMIVEGSNDGVNYDRINKTTDSLNLTDVAIQWKTFAIYPALHKYYRIKVTPTSATQSARLTSVGLWAIGR